MQTEPALSPVPEEDIAVDRSAIKRRASAAELRELERKLDREHETVLKQHLRYLSYAKLEGDKLSEQYDWMRLVNGDHKRALDTISSLTERAEENAQSRPDTPALPPQLIRTEAQVVVVAASDSDSEEAESHSSEVEHAITRPMSTLSVPLMSAARGLVTPPLSNSAPTLSIPVNPLMRVVKQGTLTSRAIDFFSPKRNP